jgi:hypothetical protein
MMNPNRLPHDSRLLNRSLKATPSIAVVFVTEPNASE